MTTTKPRPLMLLAAVLLLAAGGLSAQDKARKMSLNEALAITEEANFEIRMAEADKEKAQARYRQTSAAFLPQLSIQETGVTTNDPLQVFGFKLKQEEVTSADFNPARLNDPDGYSNFTTRFEARQPLFNADALFQRSALKKYAEAASEKLEGTLQHTRYKVKDTYYQLQLMSQRLKVIEKSLATGRENERQAKNFYEQDMINKADYLAAQVRVLDLESRFSETKNQLELIQDNLRYLLNISDRVAIVATDSLMKQPVSGLEIDPNASTNSRLKALEYRLSGARQMLKSSRMRFIPNINLFGSYEFNDDLPFGTEGSGYMVGATLKWDLFSGFQNVGKVMESKAALRKAELAYEGEQFQTNIEIRQAQRSLEQADKQIRFAESSVEQASEDFRIRSNRYEQGIEKTTDLLQSETQLFQSQLRYLNALYQYNISLARLELLLEREI